ncbi:unnamed protein product [Pseudo-nitzschia multistriata]|uniref:Uncharacterized protein n=1 Tax=Pseudo-nitzschia multistriata TaxID=183589 RepID=A0A448Z4Y8_9STRA|nr:unnamed protein product [Pseudo-nitzschia multistriata]
MSRNPKRCLTTAHEQFGKDDCTEWGLMHEENEKKCPVTPVQVVNEVFEAIAGTLYGKQKLDPSIVSNVRSKGLYNYRPLRSDGNDGRIGIEIDGTEFMFPWRVSQSRAQRIFSLILAAKLSRDLSWKEYENTDYSADSFRPVALCFNTIKEALLARQEMQILQRDWRKKSKRDAFGSVIIQTISDGIPKDLHPPKTGKRKYRSLKNLSVNATKGLLVVVQPTDFNKDFDPARPSLHSLNDFQKVVASAYVVETPVVVISPRFLSYDEKDAPYNEINQSGFQQASFYGGIEPPRGPNLFILRDFSPPSYCWIGDALAVGSGDGYGKTLSSRLILKNSVMDEGHPWHMYASNRQQRRVSKTADSNNNNCSSVYLGSTRSAAGRPTRALMERILLGSNLDNNSYV